MRVVRITAFAALAIVLGFIGLSLLFSDLGPDETLARRFLTAAVFYLLSGLFIGAFNPHEWAIAGVLGWGGAFLIFVGVTSGAAPAGEIAVISLVSLAPAFLGGWLGALVRRCLKRARSGHSSRTCG